MTAKGVKGGAGRREHRGEPVHRGALRQRYQRGGKEAQKAVHAALEGMTGFKVAAVNVHVGGISFN